MARIERFTHVISDFAGVTAIGQAFADEIFTVYATKHPNIVSLPIEMNDTVEMMVNRAIGKKDLTNKVRL